MLYPVKVSFKIDGGMKIFYDKQKLKQYMAIKTPLHKILKGIPHTEDENKDNHESTGVLNFMRTDSQRVALNGCTHSNL
jgi:hypothetical protein